ncbi:hypothetical protein [Acidisoma sp. C75]
MRARSSTTTEDWTAIERSILDEALCVLRSAAAAKAGLEPAAIGMHQIGERRARLEVAHPDLVQRERGSSAHPPAPFLSPDDPTMTALQLALANKLRQSNK